MRRLYLTYPIRDAVRLELSWTHYRHLLRVENAVAREWYAKETIASHWSARALERQISTLYYERLLSSSIPEPVRQEALEKTTPLNVDAKSVLRDPYVLDFLNLPSASVLESTVEQGLIDNLQHFLLELGRGFAFVSRQQRLSVDDQDFYLDLVFYNFKLKCFLLIDIKVGRLTHQDVGQMDTYIRLFDQHYKGADDNPTIGLILCSEKSTAVAKYSVLADSQQLFAAKYLPFLPTEEELRLELQRERGFKITALRKA
jgi:predicted nuclease of restriction endonuclease-like (RecB) superfamily